MKWAVVITGEDDVERRVLEYDDENLRVTVLAGKRPEGSPIEASFTIAEWRRANVGLDAMIPNFETVLPDLMQQARAVAETDSGRRWDIDIERGSVEDRIRARLNQPPLNHPSTSDYDGA